MGRASSWCTISTIHLLVEGSVTREGGTAASRGAAICLKLSGTAAERMQREGRLGRDRKTAAPKRRRWNWISEVFQSASMRFPIDCECCWATASSTSNRMPSELRSLTIFLALTPEAMAENNNRNESREHAVKRTRERERARGWSWQDGGAVAVFVAAFRDLHDFMS
ncbi:hypothetical protein BHM03_00003072 [Ensete ventricosum]|nr:hypothetical protein BHM03_00003072 [Ensete ventricosum]